VASGLVQVAKASGFLLCRYGEHGQYHSARTDFLSWLATYMTEQGVKDTEVWRVLKEQQWRYRHPTLRNLLGYTQHLMGWGKELLRLIARRTLPVPVHRWLRVQWRGQEYCPPVGYIRFGSLRRVMPISRKWGFDRGLPIDRYYIERFLSAHALDICGYVLEIQDNAYTRKFGVTESP